MWKLTKFFKNRVTFSSNFVRICLPFRPEPFFYSKIHIVWQNDVVSTESLMNNESSQSITHSFIYCKPVSLVYFLKQRSPEWISWTKLDNLLKRMTNKCMLSEREDKLFVDVWNKDLISILWNHRRPCLQILKRST